MQQISSQHEKQWLEKAQKMITQPVHDEITSQARQQFAKDFCILTSRIDWLALMSSFIP